jgi:hypothetical protein
MATPTETASCSQVRIPDIRHFEYESFDRALAGYPIGVDHALGTAPRTIDLNRPALRINQPGEFGAVIDPLAHLCLQG